MSSLTFDVESIGAMNSAYGQVVTWAAKWSDSDDVIVKDIRDFKQYKTEPWESTQLLSALADLMDGADMLISYFGKGYDLKVIQGPLTKIDRFLPTVPHIDLYYTSKAYHKLGRGSLDAALTYFGLDEQKFHLPPSTWLQAMHGDNGAMDLLKERAASDVIATEQLYYKLRPLIRTHPKLSQGECNKCGSNYMTSQGQRITATGRVRRRLKCESCGGWQYALELEDATS